MKLKGFIKTESLMIATILLLAIVASNIQKGWAYDETLTTKNHNYPVYLILTMKLNNKTIEGLTASVKVFNSTEKKWITNYALLEQIQKDLDGLPSKVEGLKQATMYDYNDTYVPGCVYILLSPGDLGLAGEVSNKTIAYIKNNSAKWWYVADITFETLNLAIFGPPLRHLAVDRVVITTVPGAQNADYPAFYKFDNGSYGLNPYAYSIINNTIVPHYLQRGNISATLFIHNGTQWLFNTPFAEYLNYTFKTLNEQYLLQSYNITLNSTTSPSALEHTLDFYRSMGWNTDPTVNANTTKDDIANIIELGTVFSILINYNDYPDFYSPNNTYESFRDMFGDKWDEILVIYFTLYILLSHCWFCTAELSNYLEGGEQASSGFTFLAILFALFVIEAIVSKRKVKIYS